MKIGPYFNRLSESGQYQDFAKHNKDAFMVAGFFILDFESGKNMHQIDYYVPSKKKVAAFTLDKGVQLQMMDMLNAKMPEKLDIKTKIDLDALKGILLDEMKNRSITEDIKKIIAILQMVDGKRIWNLNCVLSGMGILRAHVEDETESVLKMEKLNMMDFVKKMPTDQLKALKEKMAKGKEESSGKGEEKNLAAELKKLDMVKDEIEKQEEEIKEQIKKGMDKASKKAKKK
jgi:hypothetical protein